MFPDRHLELNAWSFLEHAIKRGRNLSTIYAPGGRTVSAVVSDRFESPQEADILLRTRGDRSPEVRHWGSREKVLQPRPTDRIYRRAPSAANCSDMVFPFDLASKEIVSEDFLKTIPPRRA
jgi:hypothetical protein